MRSMYSDTGWKKRRQVAAGMGTQFAADQIQRLDAVGAFVDLGDAGVANVLLHTPFANVAVAAVDLHTQVCDLAAQGPSVRL